MATPMTITYSSADDARAPDRLDVPAAGPLSRFDLPAGDLLMLGWLVTMSVGHLTFFTYPYWTSRLLLVLLIVPFGMWSWVRLWRGGDGASRTLSVFIAVLVVAALLSEAPRNSLLGIGGSSQSVAFFAALGCVWAAGRFGSPAVRELAGPVLMAALAVHLLFGLCQILLEIDAGPLATFNGRAAGLAANAVYFGALMTTGVVLAGRRVLRDPSAPWVAVLVVMSFALSLSGSRVALLAVVLVLAGSAVKRARRRVALVGGSLISGLLLAELFSWVANVESSVDRAVGKGADGRSQVWGYAWKAFLERPILGWGPDLFRTAIEGRLSDGFVRTYDVPGVQNWTDPHNVIVGVTLGSGVIGIGAFAVFVFVAARRARGDLAACSAAIALTWLFQPLVIMTAPIAALLLGLSAPNVDEGVEDGVDDEAPSRDRSTVTRVLLAIGVIAASVVAFLDLRIAAADGVSEEAGRWDWYLRDPRVANRLSEQYIAATFAGEGDFAPEALAWSQRAVEQQPERALWWARLAYKRLLFGDDAGADAAAREALRRQPNEPQAWLVLRRLAADAGDDEGFARAHERVCTLAPARCSQSTDDLRAVGLP
jgi:O-antigen ligase